MLILNDVHIGHQRQTGTTPTSREALRSYLFQGFKKSLETTENHVCILGDIFDQFEIDPRDWIETYNALVSWLQVSENRVLTLVAGNHDHSPKALRVSSFQMLCEVLKKHFSSCRVKVVAIDEWSEIEKGVYALSHCSNQDIFNEKLKEVLSNVERGDRVLLHCNYDNHFAAVSDHSLNVSEKQAKSFDAVGVTLYFAHEHQARRELEGSVVVFGNQWPTSVSDCLGNSAKFATILTPGDSQRFETWPQDGGAGFLQIDWRNLSEMEETTAGFIRVSGTASANEAGDCISAIAKLRAKSSAFVITNAVKIDGIADNEALPESFEAAKAFDVMEFIYSNLEERQQEAVKKLIERAM